MMYHTIPFTTFPSESFFHALITPSWANISKHACHNDISWGTALVGHKDSPQTLHEQTNCPVVYYQLVHYPMEEMYSIYLL